MGVATWWSDRRLGLVSLAVSLLEVIIVYGGVALIVGMKLQHTPPRLLHVASIAWLLGTFFSFSFAIAGLIADAQRLASFVALVMAMATFLVCGLQMIV
jgi:hypothetical protein